MTDPRETVHCPFCGRFVTGIQGHMREEGLKFVTGKCANCGTVKDPTRIVDGYETGYGWDDFNRDG